MYKYYNEWATQLCDRSNEISSLDHTHAIIIKSASPASNIHTQATQL